MYGISLLVSAIKLRFFQYNSQNTGWEERLQNGVFCVAPDVKTQSINHLIKR